MLKASTSTNSGTIAPAWGGLTLSGHNTQYTHRRRVSESAPCEQERALDGNRTKTTPPVVVTNGVGTHAAGSPCSPEALVDIEAVERELERHRCDDLQANASYVRELRALVTELVQSSGMPENETSLQLSIAKSNDQDRDLNDNVSGASGTAKTKTSLRESRNYEAFAQDRAATTNCTTTNRPVCAKGLTAAGLGSRPASTAELLIKVRNIHQKYLVQ